MNTLKINLRAESKAEIMNIMADLAKHASQLVHLEVQQKDDIDGMIGIYAVIRDEPAALNAIVTELLTQKAEFIVNISQEQPNQPLDTPARRKSPFG